MSLYYLTNDLLFSSRVTGVAQQLGLPLQIVGSLEALLTQAKSDGCRFVLIDLSLSGLDAAEAIEQIKTEHPAVQLVAYGPHVHEGLLQAAADAGCDEVLSRGQFHQNIQRVLQLYGNAK